MGGWLSLVLAGIFTEDLEEKAIAQCAVAPLLYKRYVDDIVVIWNRLKGHFSLLLDSLNSQHPNIVLTVEEERNGSLPFLDLLITRPKGAHQYSLVIFRKPTHLNRYIDFCSAHPESLKKNLFTNLVLHAKRLLRQHLKQLSAEISFLYHTFTKQANGYPKITVNKWLRAFERELEQ